MPVDVLCVASTVNVVSFTGNQYTENTAVDCVWHFDSDVNSIVVYRFMTAKHQNTLNTHGERKK